MIKIKVLDNFQPFSAIKKTQPYWLQATTGAPFATQTLLENIAAPDDKVLGNFRKTFWLDLLKPFQYSYFWGVVALFGRLCATDIRFSLEHGALWEARELYL